MRLHKHKLALQVFLYEGTMHMLASVMCKDQQAELERVLKIYSASWSFEMGAKQCPPSSADQAFEMTYESPQPRNRIPRIFPFVPSAFSLNPTSFFLSLSLLNNTTKVLEDAMATGDFDEFTFNLHSLRGETLIWELVAWQDWQNVEQQD